mmetsp:Transcript_14164/g.35076  ORF Transcript_14164/g.35076 Transcript_14164/m.35076 type:complete len:200 (-) Transcript_14164:399-998(-)
MTSISIQSLPSSDRGVRKSSKPSSITRAWSKFEEARCALSNMSTNLWSACSAFDEVSCVFLMSPSDCSLSPCSAKHQSMVTSPSPCTSLADGQTRIPGVPRISSRSSELGASGMPGRGRFFQSPFSSPSGGAETHAHECETAMVRNSSRSRASTRKRQEFGRHSKSDRFIACKSPRSSTMSARSFRVGEVNDPPTGTKR